MTKLNFTTKLYEACSEDELRPVMMCVHFINGFACASDAYIVVRQSLEYHTIQDPQLLDGKSIHRDNYKAIMQFDTAQCQEDGIRCCDKDGRTAFFEYFDRQGVDIPNFDNVFNEAKCQSVDFIGINPDLLSRVAKCLHLPDKTFRIRFCGIAHGMLIDVLGIDNQDALVMPALLSDSLF